MFTYLRPALTLTVAFTLLTGVAYPLAVTGIAQTLFPAKADGSLIERNGQVIGSALIGQNFTSPGYLHPRPSASGYDAAASGASNLGPTSAALVAAVAERRAAFFRLNGVEAPIDAVTASGSGLDPDISVQNAQAQSARIAGARGVDVAKIDALIAEQVEAPLFGLYGLPHINVLATNLALDAAFAPTP